MKDIPGWLTPHEGVFLSKAAKSLRAGGAIVEIGSFQGKSTICLAQSGEKVYAIDPHKGVVSGTKTSPTFSKFKKNISEAKVDSLVIPIVKTSQEAAKGWKKPIKFLFIDGLHDRDHALEDFFLWSAHVTPGGMIAMHDAFCGWRGSGDVAMRHMVYSVDFSQIGVVGSIIFGVKGKVFGLGRIDKLRNELMIELCQSIYRVPWIPRGLAFILVHRFLRIFLVNRFTSFG